MFKSYFKIAIRNLLKLRVYAFINLAGLAVGFATCLLILLYVQDELSFDRSHSKADRIYRATSFFDKLMTTSSQTVQNVETDWIPTPLAPIMAETISEIENMVCLRREYGSKLISHGGNAFYEENIYYTEPALFEIFDFPIIAGNAKTDLARPYTVFISRAMAEKYFGSLEVVGKSLLLENKQEFEITGVFENVPRHSHLQFDFLLSLESFFAQVKKRDEWNRGVMAYLLLKKGVEPQQLEQPFALLAAQYKGVSHRSRFGLIPLTDIHLYAMQRFGKTYGENRGDIRYVWLFSAIAILILAIACINYMNLATARSTQRSREVGVRKVVGATRSQVVAQFLGEAILLTFIAALAAVTLCELALPYFKTLVERDMSLDFSIVPAFWLILPGATILVGAFAGSYPAFFLSRFRPAEVLKKQQLLSAANRLRKWLVVAQFAISIALILSAVVIKDQLGYVQTRNLGFNKDQVLVVDTKGVLGGQHRAFINVLKTHTNILNATATSALPGQPYAIVSYDPKEVEDYSGDAPALVMHLFDADQNFVETLGIELAAGRLLTDTLTTDETQAVLVNEAAVAKFGWWEAVGKYLGEPDKRRYVVGVVKDFHLTSLRSKIEPALIRLSSKNANYVAIRVQPQGVRATLEFVRKTWKQFAPSHPFEYAFLDQTFASMYRTEERLGQLMGAAAALAIFTACLGLFGLAAFAAERRTKEIGIRKALGASVSGIVTLLSRDFVKLVLLANLVAWPVAYFTMNKWLQNFAYRIDIGWWMFTLAGGLALLIALATVSTQAIKAAKANPVEALRYE